ncbi:hypothetical protein PI23P_02857 [Polaribacter irgensii 23-P]|uniref:Uncharacterized protein n=1 Tax=Polaribacter irgensii 23-P TaxID=313594 RepID=A4BWQ8_9FLAO|nr:hypothetical protein PI23P_02857 [Polaribacter irgensii 23-P]
MGTKIQKFGILSRIYFYYIKVKNNNIFYKNSW